jgi:hypothetical protein
MNQKIMRKLLAVADAVACVILLRIHALQLCLRCCLRGTALTPYELILARKEIYLYIVDIFVNSGRYVLKIIINHTEARKTSNDGVYAYLNCILTTVITN